MDHTYTIASELQKHIDFRVYITAKQKTEEINEFCKKLNARFVKRLRFINPLSLINELRFLRLLGKLKCDMVWFDTFSVHQALFVRFFIRNFLVNTHDAELHPEERDFHGIFARWLTFKLHKKHVCLVSETQAGVFQKRFGIKPRVFQLPIIDYYEVFSSKPAETGFKPVSAVLRFLFFGSVLPYKGIETLLDAAEILQKKGIECELNISGRINYNEKSLTERIKRLNCIRLRNEFIPYNEVYEIFANNDVLILPYSHVTQCGPLLIAYNRNMPAICNNVPGFAEYVDDGKSGLLFDGTAQLLAEKMEYIINHPDALQKMKTYIVESIKNKFSMKALFGEYIKNLVSIQ